MTADMLQQYMHGTFMKLGHALSVTVFYYSVLLNFCDFNDVDIFFLETKGQTLQHACMGLFYGFNTLWVQQFWLNTSIHRDRGIWGPQISQCWIKVRKNYVCIPKELTPEENPESVLLIVRVLKKWKSYKPMFFLFEQELKGSYSNLFRPCRTIFFLKNCRKPKPFGRENRVFVHIINNDNCWLIYWLL